MILLIYDSNGVIEISPAFRYHDFMSGDLDLRKVILYNYGQQKQPGRNADSRGDDDGFTDFPDDDDFLRPAAAETDVFDSQEDAMAGEAGEGEREGKMESAKEFLRLAVELSIPNNSALGRETVRQRMAKLQDALLVCRSKCGALFSDIFFISPHHGQIPRCNCYLEYMMQYLKIPISMVSF